MILNERDRVIMKPGIKDLQIYPDIFLTLINDRKAVHIQQRGQAAFPMKRRESLMLPVISTGINSYTIFNFRSPFSSLFIWTR